MLINPRLKVGVYCYTYIMNPPKCLLAWVLILAFLVPNFILAEISKGTSLSSDSFRVLDSQHSLFGGTASSSSSNFILSATIGDFAIGSSSITNFGLRSGFLYFPKVTAAVLNTATAGDAQVALSWTAATAHQGWSIGGYNVCHKSTGSYTCVDVGNVTSSTKTGLTNGTTYTFKIEAYDGLTAKNVIAESNEKTATPAAAATPTPAAGGGGGGGGGGGYIAPSYGTVIIKGIAYPQSTVSILIDGIQTASTRAGSNAKFEVTLNNIIVGLRTIGFFATDLNGRKSITVNFNSTVNAGTTVILTDVLLPTTIDVSAVQLNKGEILRIFGQTAPQASVDIHVQSKEVVTKTIADSAGAYAIRFDTAKLTEDEHITKSRATIFSLISPFSRVIQFIVGRGIKQLKTADLNKDGRVNIIDFSILLYWWNTTNTKGLDLADINGDRRVNIIDFSVMLFQWTG